MKKRIVIDLVPIRVGEGGTGSGIWTYARELLRAMDQQEFQGLEIQCLVNQGQEPYLPFQNIKKTVFPNTGKNIIRRLFWVHVRLPWFCLSRKADVLHKVATETPWFCSAKRITTIHDFYYEYLLENHPPESIRLYERLENVYFSIVTKRCFKKSQALITVSEATRDEAVQRYPESADRIRVIHHGSFSATREHGESQKEAEKSGNAVDDSSVDFLQSPTSNLQPDVFSILCVAKFMEHKGQHLLIRAFDVLLDQHPELEGRVSLSLRGFHNDGAYFRRIMQQVNESRYAASVHFIPFNPDEQVDRIYVDADLVVLLSAYEGFGLPVLEAQGGGIPVVCSDLPVLREVGGEGAVYVDREDQQGIVDALRRFVADGEYYNAMRAKAAENLKRFSWERAAAETINCYEHVLED